MECLVKLQKRPKFIDAIEKFQLSGAYPVFFAVLCAISGLGNKYVYLPIISVLALSILFSVFFVRDNKVFITPIFMIYYALGTDSPKAFVDSKGNVTAAFDPDGFMGICILAAIIVIPFLIRFITDGSIAYAFKNRGITFYGIAGLNIAILLGGIFSEYWSPVNIAYGFALIAGLDMFYLVLYPTVKRADRTIITYLCRILVLTCLLIATQVILLVLKLNEQGLFLYFSPWNGRWVIQREYVAMSWGISTIIGASSVVGIPAALFLAKQERFPALYYLAALVMWGGAALTNSRSSMLAGLAFLIVGIIIISFSGKNKRCNLMFSISLVSVVILTFVLACRELINSEHREEILYGLSTLLERFKSVDDRISIYDAGIKDYLIAPIFGVGWNKGALSPELRFNNFYSNMYHCIVIQMGASAGTVGLLALIFHVKDIFILAFKRISLDRIFLLSIPAIILLMSLVDNFIFYLNIQIFYVAFLALAEKHLLLSDTE